MTPEDRQSAAVFAVLFLKFAECCRLIAAVYLLLFSASALQWLVTHPSYVIQQEITALSQLKNLGASTGEQRGLNAEIASQGSIQGELETSGLLLKTQVEVPIIGGLVSVAVPPVAWLVICIIGTIFLVVFVVGIWQQVVTLWITALGCSWTSFLAILGCIWSWIWVIISTILTVILTVLAVILVVFNIVAFVAALL